MSENLPCQRHEEQIKTLYKQGESTNKRIDNMEVKIDNMTDMKIAINTISLSMEHIVEHNKRQDSLNEKQNRTLENMNQNLTELNEAQRVTNDELRVLGSRVDKVENKVDKNEEKNNIDIRDIQKKWYTDFLSKYGIPIALISVLGMEIFRFIKG